jgi:hypothetical protein
MQNPEDGYTVIIACMKDLAAVAAANIRLIGQMKLDNMHELILLFDCKYEDIPEIVMSRLREVKAYVPARIICSTPKQMHVSHLINWGWVFSWLSWCIGIGAAKTKHVLLHDLDAMAIEPTLFETLYANATASGAQFHGIRQRIDYPRSATEPLVATFELIIEADYLRREFKPFEGFNKLALIDGECVDFDTFLYTQWCSSKRSITPIDESQLVHPSQLICAYTDFISGRNLMNGSHNLLVLPYLMYLGGDDRLLN